MPNFNEFYYANGYYGIKGATQYSAEPVTVTALDYQTIRVEFLSPTGSYSDFRIVRSQLGMPQTQEDGAIIYASNGAPFTTSLLDTASNILAPLVYGKFVFYRAWVRRADSSYWVSAGEAFTLLPSPHSLGIGPDAVYSGVGIDGFTTDDVLVSSDTLNGVQKVDPLVSTTHQRFMSMLPRVITTTTNSSVDVIQDTYDRGVDESGGKDNSLLSTFLSAFSFTFDEFLTFASLIAPDTSVHWSGPAAIFLGSQELGITNDVEPVTITQRRLLRNAISIYSEKGTSAGLELLVQSMTAYDATISVTNNLLLTVSDATFNFTNWTSGALGNWRSLSDALTLTPVSTVTTLLHADVPGTLDEIYCAQVSSTITGKSIALGTANPVTTGIPVTAGLAYSYSFYAKEGEGSETEPIGSDNVTIEVHWYDRYGQPVANTNDVVVVEAGSTWTRYSVVSKVAPAKAVYAGIVMTFAEIYPVYLDMVQFEQSATITDYQEPRGAIVALNPSKTNYIYNSTFQLDNTYWVSPTNGSSSQLVTSSTNPSRSGTCCLQVTSNGNGPLSINYSEYIPVTAGQYYSGSGYLQDVNMGSKYHAVVTFYTGTGHTLLSSITGSDVALTTDSWTRATVSGKAPATATSAKISFVSVGTPYSGRVVKFDAAQFENTPEPTDYFDGYLLDDGGAFVGAVNVSYSVNYPAFLPRKARLITELKNYLGLDTPYYLCVTDGSSTRRTIANLSCISAGIA